MTNVKLYKRFMNFNLNDIYIGISSKIDRLINSGADFYTLDQQILNLGALT